MSSFIKTPNEHVFSRLVYTIYLSSLVRLRWGTWLSSILPFAHVLCFSGVLILFRNSAFVLAICSFSSTRRVVKERVAKSLGFALGASCITGVSDILDERMISRVAFLFFIFLEED